MAEDVREDTDRLEETRRELDRLAKLRRNVASGLLEVSEAAKRDAERLLSASAEAVGSDDASPGPIEAEPRRVWSSPLLYGSFAVGLLCGFLLASFLRTPQALPAQEVEVAVADSSPSETPPDLVPETVVPTPSPVDDDEAASPTPSPVAEAALPAPTAEAPAVSTVDADTSEALVLTLRPRRACWLRVRVDSGEAVERLLSPDETVVLQVEEEAVLRIGDAAALALLINDQPTRSLGADGQVVELRITPSNFRTFLNGI